MTPNYEHAAAHIAALTGSTDTPIEFRGLHDVDKSLPGFNRRGTLAMHWQELCQWQEQGRGVFLIVNETDGLGRQLQNITDIRAHYLDLDGNDATQQHELLKSWVAPSHFVVRTSPGKFHEYFKVAPYRGTDRFFALQSKLDQQFHGDWRVRDATRVLRLAGFYHLKDPANPHLITLEAGAAWGKAPYDVGSLEQVLSHIAGASGGGGSRLPLGEPGLAAPSLSELIEALDLISPDLDRDEWIKVTAAFKQAGTGLGIQEPVLRMLWDAWCAKYTLKPNDPGENSKQWNDIRSTNAGWPFLAKRSGLKARRMFGQAPGPGQQLPVPSGGVAPVLVDGQAPAPKPDKFGTFLNPVEQAAYFQGCTYVVSLGRILVPNGMFLDQSQFNAVYGGKAFQIKEDGQGMTTDEAWKAVTRGQLFKIPQVHFTRFLPAQPIDVPFTDEFGRLAINTYRPARIAMTEGDPLPFVTHMRHLLPTENDVLIFLSYLAHCVQRPGSKAKWAPLLQSAEGAGKGIIKEAMLRAMGRSYVHNPNARELGEGGGKFNGWMEGKLLIVADEIRVDERRDMIEVLKPMITETTLEIQRKGVDQVVGDNVSNWIMFSNYKDAIPINNNSRRFAIFYSPIQTIGDLNARGMGENDPYFPKLWGWLENGGYEIVAHYLKHFQIPEQYDPAVAAHRAPLTSSHAEALRESRGQYEQKIADAVDEGRPGFRGGWVSSWAVAKLLGGKVAPRTVSKAIEAIGYVAVGRSTTQVLLEDMSKPTLYNLDPHANLAGYPAAQGYSS